MAQPKKPATPRQSGVCLNTSQRTRLFTFRGHLPQIEAEVDGLAARMVLDAGDRSSLALHVPFVEAHGLVARYAPAVEAITGWGLGGPIPARLTRVGHLRFAGQDVPDVVTRLPMVEAGAFTRGDVAGSIGTGVLKRFNIVRELL